MQGDPNITIEQIEYDSRLIQANSLFVAIKGFQQDGYNYVEQAIEKGAVAVIGERKKCKEVANHVTVPDIRRAMADIAAKFYDHPSKAFKVCGVTGTNGKTTTCFLIREILEARGKTTGLVTSLVYDTGLEKFKAERTTPESLDLQRLFFLMKKNLCVNAVMEVSSHAIALHRIDSIKFRVAVFTNLTRDHLDFHKNMEEYLQTKAQLIKRLDGPLSYAVINLDQPEFRQLIGDITSNYIGYSLSNEDADVYCANYELRPAETIFDLVTPMGTRTIHLRLPGRFNLINAICAAAAGLASGVDLETVVIGLEKAMPIPGRFNPINAGQPFAVYVDYAHTPDAIQRLCESARELCKGKLYVLFGCGGDRDQGKRPLMGKAATQNADFAVVTSDNPRSEDPNKIIKQIKKGLVGKNYEVIPDRKEAIEAILKMATPGDAVLLAGKGAENYQEIKGQRHPFDDSAEACRVLASIGFECHETAEGK